jgi:tRNA A-37 threonylcarbamoyl transferase component Bud32
VLFHGSELVATPAAAPLLAGCARPRDVVGRWIGTLPPGGRSAVREAVLPEGRYFVKAYAYSGLWRLRTLFIAARAGREFRNLKRMAAMGFRVPEPVAWGQERGLGFVSVSFVATRAVDGAVSLRELIDRPDGLPPPAERRRLVEEFARTLRRAHDEGFFVHTLRFKNLLLSREGERWVLTVIDVPFAGIWRWRLFPGAGRVRDLAVLMRGARRLLSRTDRMRFARAYGADRGLLCRAQAYQERHYPGSAV